jgi:hypothetical protein
MRKKNSIQNMELWIEKKGKVSVVIKNKCKINFNVIKYK